MQRMRRLCVPVVVLLCALAAASPALAQPHFSKSRSAQISTLVARFVDDMVKRQDLADGWKIAGPDERGTLSREAWVSGRQVPVQSYDVLNNPRTAWYPRWKTRSEVGLVVSLKTGHGKNAEMLQAEMVLEKLHRRGWVVDSFYVDGIFRLGAGHSGSCVSSKCRVTGLADYAPSGGGGVAAANPRIGGHVVLWILSGVGSLVLLTLLSSVLYVRRRDRRIRRAYYGSR